MGQKQEARTLYSIDCACGAKASMDARSFGKPQICRKCGASFTVGWGKDPKTRKAIPVSVALARKRPPTPLRVVCACGYTRAVTASEAAGNNRCPGCGRVMIVEKPAAPKARESDRIIKLSSAPVSRPAPQAFSRVPTPLPGSRTPTPPPGAFTKAVLACECGQSLEILKAFDANGTVCPACGRTITMEKIRAPQSKHTVIRPRFAPKAGPAAPIVPPPPAAKPKPAPEGMFDEPATVEFTVEEESTPAGPARSTYQEAFCPCGEALMIGMEDAGRNIQCPTCLTLIAVDKLRDGNSGNIVLRVRAIGKMDQDTWSLSDFA